MTTPTAPTPVDPLAAEASVAITKFGTRRTLRRRIMAFVTALNVVSTIVACTIAYTFQRDGFLHNVDRVLTAGAVGAQHVFGHDFHDRMLNLDKSKKLTEDEELYHVKRISDLADRLNLEYIGALVYRDGKYFYTITSSPQCEIRDGTYDRIWTEYRDVTPELAQSFVDGKIRFQQHTDQYGTFRSVYVPFRMAEGAAVDYVFIADMSLGYIHARLHETLAKTAFAGLVISALSLWCTWVLANNLAGPLARLAGLIRSVAQHDFRMQPEQRTTLGQIAVESHEEVSQVATAFERMETRLQDYFTELKLSLAERERISSELSIAHDIQVGLLPKQLPEIPGCDVFARVIPAKEVGGDLFDVGVMEDGRLLLVIADVSGKGISAGLFMAVAKTLLHVGRTHGVNAHGIVEFLNEQLAVNNDALMFVTMFLAIFDPKTGEMVYANAGHNPPYIRREDGTVESLTGQHGLALGISPGQTYPCDTTYLRDGDLLLLYTDGITEAQDVSQSLFSEARLEECLAAMTPNSAGYAGAAVIDAVMEYQGSAPQADDITLVALRYTAPVDCVKRLGAQATS